MSVGQDQFAFACSTLGCELVYCVNRSFFNNYCVYLRKDRSYFSPYGSVISFPEQ
jgi:hypothetical protein